LEPDDNPSENSVEIANREYINPERAPRREYGGDPPGGNGGNGGGGNGPPRITPANIIKNIDKIDKIATAGVSVIKSIIDENKKAEEVKTV
jgi:hypothetical protein